MLNTGYMEYSTEMSPDTAARRAAIAGLAVVGFFALVFIGMVLAIYAARFIPKAANGLSGAAVYLSSLFTPADNANLQVVPSTIPFGTSTSTPIVIATTTVPVMVPATTTATTTHPVTTPTPKPTYPTYPVTVVNTPPPLYGLPDLAVYVTAVGYLNDNDNSTNSFIASSYVPNGKRGAVKFSVRNIGTNRSGTWSFNADLPTIPTYTYNSPYQNALNPGDRVDFILGFDDSYSGTSRNININVDPSHVVNESDENNNFVSASININ
jgi:hypothetical protein